MAYDILDMAMVCYPTEYTPDKVPSRGQRDRLNKSHNLERLFSDLEKSCSTLNINIPEKQFVAVIDLIKEYEVNPTWSRYSSSGHGAHVENEVQLPIVQLTNNLGELFEVVSYAQPDDSESLESELYFMFSSLTSRMEE
jgi:hypothetical protein